MRNLRTYHATRPRMRADARGSCRAHVRVDRENERTNEMSSADEARAMCSAAWNERLCREQGEMITAYEHCRRAIVFSAKDGGFHTRCGQMRAEDIERLRGEGYTVCVHPRVIVPTGVYGHIHVEVDWSLDGDRGYKTIQRLFGDDVPRGHSN